MVYPETDRKGGRVLMPEGVYARLYADVLTDSAIIEAGPDAFTLWAKGLAWSLIQLGIADKAREVLDRMLRLEPSDPLGAAEMRSRLERPAAD